MFGSVELRGGHARAVLVPALGGKISELWFGDRQWLWRNAQLPFRSPVAGAAYALTADNGGFDECFPTTQSCTLPSLVRGAGGRELPDHGELWSQQPSLTLTTGADGHRAHVAWIGERLPYRFERTLVVTPMGEVRCEYAATNLGELRIPFLWAAHPLLPLGRDTQLKLPDGARVRIWTEHGIDLGGAGAEHRWPRLRSGGQLLDLSAPGRAWKQPFACMLYLDLPPGEQALHVVTGGEQLTAAFHADEVPTLGLWINCGGWNPLPRTSWLPWRKPAPYFNLGFEPAIGAPGALSEALGAWDGAHWIEPGATRRWTVTWTAGLTHYEIP
ncbi:MAG: aldose epimerase family protein [Gemmatimonadaceae bacterium]